MMNQRDVSEIRRRLNPDRRNPTLIRGCYVGHDGQIISSFAQPVFDLAPEENEKYMAIFKRTLSGTLGQNLVQIDYAAAQAAASEQHALLQRLRESALRDDEAAEAFFGRVIACLQEESVQQDAAQSVREQQEANNYLILLMHDGYDVPFRDGNDEADAERSDSVFSYILCGVCPVKQTKSVLSYYAARGEFISRALDWVVSAPDMGFLFPAFEDRCANVFGALYYTRESANVHPGFVDAVFHAELPMPAQEQKETFQAILQDALGDECSMDVVQAVHETVSEKIRAQKSDKKAEPLHMTREDVREVLEDCGVSKERADAFTERYTETFGAFAQLPAVNLVSPRQFKVETPGVSIRVDPEHSALIQTRVIDGRPYILVPAEGGVEVNGVSVKIE